MNDLVERQVVFVASVQDDSAKRTYWAAQGAESVSDAVKPIRPRTAPLPLAAGQFGWKEWDGLPGDRPSGCPSLEQFEARFAFMPMPAHPPKAI